MSHNERKDFGADSVQITETVSGSKTGYFANIKSAFGGIFLGIILFLASFALLFWNEWRADPGLIAETAVEVQLDAPVNPALNGQLISVSGQLKTDQMLSDDQYLKPLNYLSLNRTVEVYAWVQNSDTKETKNKDGTVSKTTNYTYVKKWVSEPTKTSSFVKPDGHHNPEKYINDYSSKVPEATLGNYTVKLEGGNLPGASSITLNNDTMISLTANTTASTITPAPAAGQLTPQAVSTPNPGQPLLVNNYLYLGKGNFSMPEIGDIRISFTGVPSDVQVTVFGKLDNSIISEFKDKHGNRLFEISSKSREATIEDLKAGHQMLTWGLRVLGFILMSAGLNMIFAPISAILCIVPILGGLTKKLIGTIIFIVSVVLSIITILLSIIVQNIVLLIVLLIVLILIIVAVFIGAFVAYTKFSKSS